VKWCLSQANGPLDAVVYYEKPLLKFERILSTALAVAPRGFRTFAAAIPDWLNHKLWLPSAIAQELQSLGAPSAPVYFSEHHLSHAASAFFPSPFERAAILTLDGVGEWTTTTLGRGTGSQLELLRELRFPHSLGLLYSAFATYCGFRVNSGEYKLMGLAPYGEPRFVQTIREQLIDLRDDGSFRLNLDFFGYLTGASMTNRRFDTLFGAPPRKPDEELRSFHCDLARSIQAVTEEVILRLATTLHRETGEENLCLAGGVALNCVGNSHLLRHGPFRRIWVQPASGDAGGALGAALAFHHLHDGGARHVDSACDSMRGSFLGPEFNCDEISAALADHGIEAVPLDSALLRERIVDRLVAGDVVGFFQGRSEFGPRALGARSILADARSPEMQRRLNLKIKFRESFRPFAPIVLEEQVSEWFDFEGPSPYMLFTAPVAAAHRRDVPAAETLRARLDAVRSTIPAVTHVDFSARIQTVDKQRHPALHALLDAFADRTGCPVLVNTSFNVRGEPPVGHPRDAIEGFLATDMDALAIGDFWIEKRSVPPAVLSSQVRSRAFAPD
jgi:carbamoyltransferase